MPRVYRTRKQREQFLIRDFLSQIGYRISIPRWRESPDAILTLSKRKSRKKVAIEHTDYFNDTLAGKPSPLTPYAEFWKIVESSLVHRISHRKHLTGIDARVKLKKGLNSPPDPVKLARSLAKELIDFVETHPVRTSQHISFYHYNNDFAKFPILNSMLEFLLLLRRTDEEVFASPCSWICSNISTGHIILDLNYIKTAIENKNKKCLEYKWDDANEKWLLITAAGDILSNSAGPPIQLNWNDDELMDLCRNSPFDRIVFWERVRCWYKWLKPNLCIKQYTNTGGKQDW